MNVSQITASILLLIFPAHAFGALECPPERPEPALAVTVEEITDIQIQRTQALSCLIQELKDERKSVIDTFDSYIKQVGRDEKGQEVARLAELNSQLVRLGPIMVEYREGLDSLLPKFDEHVAYFKNHVFGGFARLDSELRLFSKSFTNLNLAEIPKARLKLTDLFNAESGTSSQFAIETESLLLRFSDVEATFQERVDEIKGLREYLLTQKINLPKLSEFYTANLSLMMAVLQQRGRTAYENSLRLLTALQLRETLLTGAQVDKATGKILKVATRMDASRQFIDNLRTSLSNSNRSVSFEKKPFQSFEQSYRAKREFLALTESCTGNKRPDWMIAGCNFIQDEIPIQRISLERTLAREILQLAMNRENKDNQAIVNVIKQAVNKGDIILAARLGDELAQRSGVAK